MNRHRSKIYRGHGSHNVNPDSVEQLALQLEQSRRRQTLLLSMMISLSCATGAVTTVPTLVELFDAHVAAAISTPWAEFVIGMMGAVFGAATTQFQSR